MNCTFFSLGMLMHGVMLEGEYDDGVVASIILGLCDEDNQ